MKEAAFVSNQLPFIFFRLVLQDGKYKNKRLGLSKPGIKGFFKLLFLHSNFTWNRWLKRLRRGLIRLEIKSSSPF